MRERGHMSYTNETSEHRVVNMNQELDTLDKRAEKYVEYIKG